MSRAEHIARSSLFMVEVLMPRYVEVKVSMRSQMYIRGVAFLRLRVSLFRFDM